MRGGYAVAGPAPHLHSFKRLWVAVMSCHSLSTAARPRRKNPGILRLCLVWAKTGSTNVDRRSVELSSARGRQLREHDLGDGRGMDGLALAQELGDAMEGDAEFSGNLGR